MEFTRDDFKGMLFDPNNEDMLNTYHDLYSMFGSKEYLEEAKKYGGMDSLLRYICFMYDKNTPLRKITQYQSRKKKALQLAGYKFLEDGQPEEKKGKKDESKTPIKDMMLGRQAFVNRIIGLYVRRFRNHEFAYLVSMEEAYFRNLEKLLGDLDAAEETKVNTLVESFKNKIDAQYQEIYLVKKSESGMVEETMMIIDEDKMGISPEDMARRIKTEYIKPI